MTKLGKATRSRGTTERDYRYRGDDGQVEGPSRVAQHLGNSFRKRTDSEVGDSERMFKKTSRN